LKRHDAWPEHHRQTISWIFSRTFTMSALLAYGLMAERHWREHCPAMVRELEAAKGLQTALLDAQERTAADMDRLIREFREQGLEPQQAHDQAWELVREKYILLRPETPE
jgi:hypothetical protein